MVRIGERVVRLTSTELHVLACLAQRAGQPLTYQQIAHAGLGSDVQSEQAAELIKPIFITCVRSSSRILPVHAIF